MNAHVRRSSYPKKHRPSETREITKPSVQLKNVQKKIKACILKKYHYSDYIYGLGGNTLHQHAAMHIGPQQLLQVDIRNFYPSIKHHRIYSVWCSQFNFPPPVARILTKLTTYGGELVQGFPTSSHLAACAAEGLTERLHAYCGKASITFTQYVDDLNFSGTSIDYKTIFKLLISEGRKDNLSIKKRKTNVTPGKIGKKITGVSLHNKRIRAPRKTRKRAYNAIKALAQNPNDKQLVNRAGGYGGFLGHLSHKDGRKYKKLLKSVTELDAS